MSNIIIPRQRRNIKIDVEKDEIKVHKVININDIQEIANIFQENRNLGYLSIQHQQDSQIIRSIFNIIPISSIRTLFIGNNDIIHVRNIEHYLLKLILNPNCKLKIIRGNIKNGHRITDDYKEKIKKSLQNNIFLIDVMGIKNEENKKIHELFNEYKREFQHSSSSRTNYDITEEETLVPFMEYIHLQNNINRNIKEKIQRYIDRKWKYKVFSKLELFQCPICYENIVNLIICRNNHKICSICWQKAIDKSRCPVCRENILNYNPEQYIPNINDIDINDIDLDDIKNIILETQIYKYPPINFTKEFLDKCSDNAIRKIFEIYITKKGYDKYFNHLVNKKFKLKKTRNELITDERNEHYYRKLGKRLNKIQNINNSLLKQNTTSSKQNTTFKYEPINVENEKRKDIIKFGNFEYNKDGKIDIIDFNEKTMKKINEIQNENIKNDVKDKLKRSSRFRKYFNNNGVNIKDINFIESFPNNNDIIQMEF